MPVATNREATGMSAATRLRTRLAQDCVVVAPGVFDGVPARLAARAGFGRPDQADAAE